MSDRQKIIERLANHDYREGLVDAEIANGIAFQLKAMLREHGWTQQELANRAAIAQPLISKYLAGYENYSLQTLKKLAAGFDVALIVSFAPFSELVDRMVNRTPATITIPSYSSDRALLAHIAAPAPMGHGEVATFASRIDRYQTSLFDAQVSATYPSNITVMDEFVQGKRSGAAMLGTYPKKVSVGY